MEKSSTAPLRKPNRPRVTLVAAMTLDGKISTSKGYSKISSSRDLVVLHILRSKHDAVMIGIRTLLQDDPRLTVRLVNGRSPTRIIVDSLARTPLDARIFATSSRVIIAVTELAPKVRIEKLRHAGARVIRAGRRQVNLKMLLMQLCHFGIKNILLEGGGALNWSMISGHLVDEIVVTIAPMIFGGTQSTTLVEGSGVKDTNGAFKLALVKSHRRNNEIVLTYKTLRALS